MLSARREVAVIGDGGNCGSPPQAPNYADDTSAMWLL